MKIDQHENLLRRYLLGELSEADQTALEQELLADSGRFDQVWAIENKLIDSYVRGEMSGADRQGFEGYYLASPLHRNRVAIAESFLKDIDRTVEGGIEVRETDPVVPWWSRFTDSWRWPQLIVGGALAMALLLISGVIGVSIERTSLTDRIAKIQNDAETERTSLKQREQNLASRNQELEKEIVDERQRRETLNAELEQLRREQQSSPLAVPSFLLTPARLRDNSALPPPTIPRLTGRARLLIELDGDDYANYQLRLQTVEAREILRRQAGKDRFGKHQAFVFLEVPPGKLTRGDYVLILFGQTADGKSEEIERYFFQVL